MAFDDFYPDGHQGGISIIQFGSRIASNGDLRLEPTPGQWAPIPKMGKRIVDKENNSVKVELWYPDSSRNMKSFNPITYPDFNFKYTIRTEAVENGIKVIVDLEKPLPEEWVNKVGFNLELFPGDFFGEHYLFDGVTGFFPRQTNSSVIKNKDGILEPLPLAKGTEFITAPGNEMKEIKFISGKNKIFLYDGRALHNNGWFVLRSLIPAGETKNVIEWTILPKINTEWRYKPVIQISQIGYHPKQKKIAVIELDKLTEAFQKIYLIKINDSSEEIIKEETSPKLWGEFLRYKYLQFDFSEVDEEGLYKIKYGNVESNQFEIRKNIFAKDVWQPTLEYFLPIQMCHMKIYDRYKVWHGLCHMDDALMAPVNHIHFDGYAQGPSTLTKYQSGEHVPGINVGGWHDAGDYDLRIESQAETIYKLSLAYELFGNKTDQTTIDQDKKIVEIHVSDGKADILQQIEHGVLSIISGYEAMGRLYKGIVEPNIKEYVHLGDAATMTDNLFYKENEKDPILNLQLPNDDRWVFTENNPWSELQTAQALAAVYRTLKNYNEELADKCLQLSEEIYKENSSADIRMKLGAAAELFLSTSKEEYKQLLLNNVETVSRGIRYYGGFLGALIKKIDDENFSKQIENVVKEEFSKTIIEQKENPYNVPYQPRIWGDGWGIQAFGLSQLFLHMAFPNIVSTDYAFNALNFMLGCHPGENTSSFVSGVGVKSVTTAYGVNRDEWSYIPGGIVSGTALIRPDFPELKVWPYFWQQTEYVLGGGTGDFILLTMAADYLLNNE